MLVLSRHRDESVILTAPGMPRIRVTVVDIRGDKIRLGFDAPIEVTCHRAEIQEVVDREAAEGLSRDPIPPGDIAP